MSKIVEDPDPGLGVAPLELCLDFVNTEGVERNEPPDRLESLELFLDWAVARGLVDATESGQLGSEGETAFLGEARELREALYRTFSALGTGAVPASEDTAVLDRHLATALPKLKLARQEGDFRWVIAQPPSRPAHLLAPIALSAADLLRSDRLDRVKECDGETCAWLFIDGSRNRSRRWCDMGDCGNRAKARRYYRKHVQGR